MSKTELIYVLCLYCLDEKPGWPTVLRAVMSIALADDEPTDWHWIEKKLGLYPMDVRNEN